MQTILQHKQQVENWSNEYQVQILIFGNALASNAFDTTYFLLSKQHEELIGKLQKLLPSVVCITEENLSMWSSEKQILAKKSAILVSELKDPLDSIRIQILTPEYEGQTCTCLCVLFSLYEAYGSSFGLTTGEYYAFDKYMVRHCAKKGLSHIAIDTLSDMVIGFVISEDIVTDVEDIPVPPKLLPILELCDDLTATYLNKETSISGDTLELWCLGVYPSYKHLGVANLLIQENVKLAQQKGYKEMVSQATGFNSARAMERQGFDVVNQFDYATHVFQGQAGYFKRIVENNPKNTALKLMRKTL